MGTGIQQVDQFAFIVIGGGTSGNVVAGRLAENPDVSVAVVEAGPGNTREIDMITTPARAMETRKSKYDWGYKATMVDRPEYTRIEKPHTRGKVLGGCSCLNYYTWVRGSHGSYDDWVEYGGNSGIGTIVKNTLINHTWNPALAKVGRNGPLDVAISDMVPDLEPFREALQKAWVSKGEHLTENVYEGQQRGLVKCMNTIYKGVRSTSVCFLDGHLNITMIPETFVKKITLKNGIATGIEAEDKNGQPLTFTAKREVILSAGVFESPQLLMVSGVGSKEQLQSFSIECQLDSKHVGQNLLDHPIMPHVFKRKSGYGLDDHLLRAGPEKQAAIDAYGRNHTGPLHSGLLELVGFPRIDSRLNVNRKYKLAKDANGGLDPFGPDGQPHFELDFVPMFADAFQWHFPTPPTGDHLTVIVDLLRPVSKPGEVRLLSADPKVQPYINLNFMDNDLDLLAMREGTRFIDDILMNGEGMKDIIGEDYPWPMPRASDEAMNRQILERLQTRFHPCGTNRLSKDINQGVVNNHLQVHGIQNLRVIDASVFPRIPDCRIQNVVYMVAEKGADMIKAHHGDLYKVEL